MPDFAACLAAQIVRCRTLAICRDSFRSTRRTSAGRRRACFGRAPDDYRLHMDSAYRAMQPNAMPNSTQRQSCRTMLSSAPLTLSPPLFMKKFTRERVVPTISASVSGESFGSTRSIVPGQTSLAQKIARSEHGDDGFLSGGREHRQLYAAILDVQHARGLRPLGEHHAAARESDDPRGHSSRLQERLQVEREKRRFARDRLPSHELGSSHGQAPFQRWGHPTASPGHGPQRAIAPCAYDAVPCRSSQPRS